MLLAAALVRLRLLDVPLERDEGTFAYAGHMLLSGVPLYTELCDLKLPGLYYTYGAFTALFGYSAAGVHAGLLLFNLATIALLFVLARREFDGLTAALTAAAYAILSLSPNVLGFAAHATQLLMLPAVAGMLLLTQAADRGSQRRLFAAGLLFGLAFTIKQSAVFFALWAGCFVLVAQLRERPFAARRLLAREAALAAGFSAPYAAVVAGALATERFGAFWFWTVEYPSAEALPLAAALRGIGALLRQVTGEQTGLWVLAGLGAVTTALSQLPLERKLLWLSLPVFMLAACSTGYALRSHYAVLLLPPVALFAGLFVRNVGRRFEGRWAKTLALVAFAVSWAEIVWARTDYFANPEPARVAREVYGANPFPESVEIGDYIRSISAPEDEILILGSEPQILVYAQRRSASKFLFVYPLVDGNWYNARLQQELIDEVTADPPAFIVHVGIRASWLDRERSNRLAAWAQGFIDAHYATEGIVEVRPGSSVYRWGREARDYEPGRGKLIRVYRRIPAPAAG